MKLYFAIVDEVGNVRKSVAVGQPIDLLKQVFISLPSAEFNLSSRKIVSRVKEIDNVFADFLLGLSDPVTIIDRLAMFLTSATRREDLAENLAEELMIFNLVDDGHDLAQFLMDLRNIFAGAATDLHAVTEEQTTLIVRIE